jgi:uncharacterized protein YfaS (alpha-2-macroglobulin family)
LNNFFQDFRISHVLLIAMKAFGFAVFAVLALVVQGAFGQEPAALRQEYAQLIERGLWRDAVTFYKEKLSPVSDARSGEDLTKAVTALGRLNEWAEFDGLVEAAVAGHQGNARLLQAAADAYRNAPPAGRIIGGNFERGWAGAGGIMLRTENRDRVRRLQLLLESLKHPEDGTVVGDGWAKLAAELKTDEAWKLQLLTPLEKLPEWEEPGPEGATEGAPWRGDAPQLYAIPASWDAAANDGERWRFALSKWAALGPETAAKATMELARFSQSQFGVDTLNEFGWWRDRDPESEKGIFSVETLADDEVLAKTSDGVRRFKLPADWHFISLYRSVMDVTGSGADAGFALAQAYLNRRQFVKAEEALIALIARHGPGTEDFRKKLLDQITGNWGRFGIADTVEKGVHPRIPLVFRNATSVKLTAAPVDMEAVLGDAISYLKGNPLELQWELLNPSAIASRIIREEQSKYVGAPENEWTVPLTPAEGHRNTRGEVEVPVGKAGAWWITAEMENGNRFHTLVWVVDHVLVHRDVAGSKQWWTADAADGAPLEGAEIEFFGYRTVNRERKAPQERRMDVETKSFTRTTDVDGRTLLKPGDLEPGYQWMAISRKAGRATTFFGFQPFMIEEPSFENGNRDISYGITDRPLYRPGDKLHVKFFLRNVGYFEPDEAKYANRTGTLSLFNGRGEEALKKPGLRTDELGALEAEVVIPKDAPLGGWQAVFSIPEMISGSVAFRVEEFRKPEFEVTVEAPSVPVKLGGKFSAKVKASYFHGAPVREAEVEVIVKRSALSERWFPAGRWDWLYGRGAWWPGADAAWHPGWSDWSCQPPPSPWMVSRRWTPDELVLRRKVKIGADGTVDVEIDTAQVLATHGDMDARYSIDARVVDASRREEHGSGSVIAARKPFEVVTWADRGFTAPGETVEAKVSAATLAGVPVAAARGTLKLFRLSLDADGKVVETEASSWPVETDAAGQISQKFPAPVTGQYRLAAELSLAGGDASAGATILNVHGQGRAEPGDWKFGPLELVADKLEYAAGDKLRLRVNSDKVDANVWLFLHVGGSSGREARRIRLDGKSLEVEVSLDRRDMPNMFVEGVTVHGARIHSVAREVLLPPEGKMIDVSVEPAVARLEPGGKTALRITLKDAGGHPVVGKAVLAVYDKALEAVAGGSNSPPIEGYFWSWRNNYYGTRSSCSVPFAAGNLVRQKQPEMEMLTRGDDAPSSSFHDLEGREGAMRMKESPLPAAAQAAPADTLAATADVGGQAAAPAVTVRRDFADLLKWSGEISTDAAGTAEVPLEFPDNLTTWKARVWVLGSGTRVGEGSTEIITSKDLLVRLQSPRFLVERDEAVLSAVVHNEHPVAKDVRISLEMEGTALSVADGKPSTVKIPAKGEARVDWKVKAGAEGIAKVRMRAETAGDGDAVERDLPVRVHGMARRDAWSRVLEPGVPSLEIPVEVPDKLRAEQTKLTVRFSPTVAGAVVDAIPYLAEFPHGCTEQTLNRFIPAVVAQRMLQNMNLSLTEIRTKRANLNPQELGDPQERAREWKQWQGNPVFDEARLKEMVASGTGKLATMQNGDGGWGWFSGHGERSYPHTTAVVVHGLLTGKAAGASINDGMLASGVAWLSAYEDEQLQALRRFADREEKTKAGGEVKPSGLPEKAKADAVDAFVREILGRTGDDNAEMLALLYRDRVDLPVYGQALLGLELHRLNNTVWRDEILTMISQFVRRDQENQTVHLELGNSTYWWYWYGSTVEAHAWYLKLLTAVKPADPDTRGLVKYLVNNRKNSHWWESTRDTAYAIESIAGYMKASGEDAPEMEVEVTLDGKLLGKVEVDRDNLFSFNGTFTLSGKDVAPGKHLVGIRRIGGGAVYANAYLEVFSLEDRLREAGLEVKVNRKISKITETRGRGDTVGQSGQPVSQQEERLQRTPLEDGATLASGDRIEVELILESKNDYEYLVFSDAKAAGLEAVDALSGYVREPGLAAYMEPRDQTVDFFIRSLPRGTHSLRYQLRAETPGTYKALPATAEAMYAPELRGNSGDFRLQIRE